MAKLPLQPVRLLRDLCVKTFPLLTSYTYVYAFKTKLIICAKRNLAIGQNSIASVQGISNLDCVRKILFIVQLALLIENSARSSKASLNGDFGISLMQLSALHFSLAAIFSV